VKTVDNTLKNKQFSYQYSKLTINSSIRLHFVWHWYYR